MTDYLNNLLQELEKVNPKTLKNNIFEGSRIDAYVYKVYDADTISCIFKFKDEYCKKNIRLLGIDSPELKSKIESEKKLCIMGRDWLKDQILNKIVQIDMLKLDKYGRQLGIIYINNRIINEEIVGKGYARAYNGGTKNKWILDQELSIINNIDNESN